MNLSNIVLIFSILILSGSSTTVFASAGNPATVIIFPSPAFCSELGVYDTMAVPVENTLASSVTGIVFAVPHNSIGQTLEVSTGSITLAGGGNNTVYVPIILPSANYSIDVFVWSVNGSSYSQSQQLQIVCPL